MNTCFLKGGIKFYRKRCKITHIIGLIHLTDKVSQTLETEKNGVKNSTKTQWEIGKYLCPVRIWADIITRLYSYPDTTYNTPFNIVWLYKSKTTITYQMTVKALI